MRRPCSVPGHQCRVTVHERAVWAARTSLHARGPGPVCQAEAAGAVPREIEGQSNSGHMA
jgi:hypothetical protein